jgi:hypothetical protein
LEKAPSKAKTTSFSDKEILSEIQKSKRLNLIPFTL